MHFLGLGFSSLATIFAVGAAVVIGLYILKLRRRPVPVPFSPLWQRVLRDKEATSLFSRLKRLLSLLLQLLLLAILVLTLGDPRRAGEVAQGRNIVVLIDTSASMQAADGSPDNAKTRIELAKEELRTRVRGLGASERMLIAEMDAVVTPISPMTGDTSRLEAAIDGIRAVDCRADLGRALRYATDALYDAKDPEIIVISDGVLGDPMTVAQPCPGSDGKDDSACLGNVRLSFIPIGAGKRNVAITQFSVRRYPLDKSRYEVMLEVENQGDKDEQVDLSLYGDALLVDLSKISIKPANGPVLTKTDGAPPVTLAGMPQEAYAATLTIVSEGPVGKASFVYNLHSDRTDGQPSAPTPMVSSTFRIPNSGLRVHFPSEDGHGGSYDYAVGTTYTWVSTPSAAKLQRFYPNLGGASRTLEARIALSTADAPKHDDLPADDHAFAVLPERRRTKVLAVTPGNTYLEAAMLLDEYLEVTTVAPNEMVSALGKAKYDVAIYDGVTPALTPGLPALYLDPHGNNGPIKVVDKPLLEEPAFDIIDHVHPHPILRWTALDNVGIAVATKLIPGPGDKVVGAANAGAILVAGSRSQTKFVMLGFDVRQSDFPLRIAWPVFLLNTINWFVEEDAEYLSSFRTGDVWHVAVPPGATNEATLIEPRPDGQVANDQEAADYHLSHTVPIQENRAVFFGTRAGFYRLRIAQPGGGERRSDTVFASNLVDPIESDIDPVRDLTLDKLSAKAPKSSGVGVRDELWIYMLIFVAAVTAIEWWTYHRRLTV